MSPKACKENKTVSQCEKITHANYDFYPQNKNVVLVYKLLYKCSESLFVHSVQVCDLSLLYVTVKEIHNGKEWLYNHIKFATDGLVFAESWTFLQTIEKSL